MSQAPGVVLALTLSLALAASSQEVPTRPFTEQGYCGLALTDIVSGHTVVSWLYPGPLGGSGLQAAVDLARPDLIVSVDGETMNAEQFRDYVRAKSPGETIEIRYRRAKRRSGTIPRAPDHEEAVRTISVKLEARDTWTGTAGRPRRTVDDVTLPEDALLDPADPNNILGAAVAEHGLGDSLRVLRQAFLDRWARDTDPHSLSLVKLGFEHPFRLPEIQQRLSSLTQSAASDPQGALRLLIVRSLDSEDEDTEVEAGESPLSDALRHLADTMRAADRACERAIPEDRDARAFAQQCLEFLRVPRRTFYIAGEESRQHIEVIRQSIDWRLEDVVAASEDLWRILSDPCAMAGDPIDAPPPLATAVDGRITRAMQTGDGRWLVVGSHEANRYDMSLIDAVIDPGGDDRYEASDLCVGSRAIIDLAGNDDYSGTSDQGPGGALLGASLIDDRAGDDRYHGELLGCGAAVFGVSLLLDRGGHDVYSGSEWSLGAACYGAGVIIDQGGGNDTYLGDYLCQGVGGPRGLGCIVDAGGRDLYRANGPTPSAYGTPAVYQSFSQGMAFGYRGYAAGGIGVLQDLGGDDRYEAGEFAQGGAYYYGLGVLHDVSGRDLYYGNRYGQGFGVHQALGVLADDAGDDVYWSMTAASQGAAWDIGAGLLIDHAGNDSYQCDGLGQGGASMQGIAMLVDLAGQDRYVARGGATQGQSGGDSYHYDRTNAFSFSLLLDLGSQRDWYSSGRGNNATESTGALNEARPQDSSLHGLFIDQ